MLFPQCSLLLLALSSTSLLTPSSPSLLSPPHSFLPLLLPLSPSSQLLASTSSSHYRRTEGRTDVRTDRQTDGRKSPLIDIRLLYYILMNAVKIIYNSFELDESITSAADQPTDGTTNRRTDGQGLSSRDARTHLKRYTVLYAAQSPECQPNEKITPHFPTQRDRWIGVVIGAIWKFLMWDGVQAHCVGGLGW